LSSACPNGYSAVGGQTLNPYGRRKFDTGGSSSGSGTAMAANYAAAAVGTETSGSILSPSSASSVVGLKPTVGLLSRGGIVPLSSTLDTPGPITRNVTDNAILLSAMTGEDFSDIATKDNPKNINYLEALSTTSLAGMRFGVSKDLLGDSLYMVAVGKIVALGGTAVEFESEKITLVGFSTLLSADMKADLPAYLEKYASENIKLRTVAEIADFNKADSLVRTPYRQTIFDGIIALQLPPDELIALRTDLHAAAVTYFDKPMTEHRLDAILSVNNRNAGMAAAAFYPCLTVPMGYRNTGTPAGITFIGRPFGEANLLKIGFVFEQATKMRKLPEAYR
ncbi:MAG TPA: amidase family protein, partial [Bacteroidales bacterium]|nr:amidase family protein [Bacteroidales bacterium]